MRTVNEALFQYLKDPIVNNYMSEISTTHLMELQDIPFFKPVYDFIKQELWNIPSFEYEGRIRLLSESLLIYGMYSYPELYSASFAEDIMGEDMTDYDDEDEEYSEEDTWDGYDDDLDDDEEDEDNYYD